MTLRSRFVLIGRMEREELSFKIVKVHGAHDEVIARVGNLLISRAAFDKALFVYPQDHLELRQGARIIAMSKESRQDAGHDRPGGEARPGPSSS